MGPGDDGCSGHRIEVVYQPQNLRVSSDTDFADHVAGEILVAVKKDADISAIVLERAQSEVPQMPSIEPIESLSSFLERHGVKKDPDLQLEVFRVRAPPGQEYYAVDLLSRATAGQAYVSLNAIYRNGAHARGSPSAHTGDLGLDMEWVRAVVDPGDALRGASPGEGETITVVDTGAHLGGGLEEYLSPHDPNPVDLTGNGPGDDDPDRHGTVVASIIASIASGAKLRIVRIASSEHPADEFRALAAMAFNNESRLINFSQVLPVQPIVGRVAPMQRHMAFNEQVAQLTRQGKIFVAAAGNRGPAPLAYPASAPGAVAVGSLASDDQLASDSRYGITDLNGDPHPLFFVAPGGGPSPQEPLLLVDRPTQARLLGLNPSTGREERPRYVACRSGVHCDRRVGRVSL